MPLIVDAPAPLEATLDPTYGEIIGNSQVELRGLVMGAGTPLKLIGFNPWSTSVRGSEKPFDQADGSYAGREYSDSKQVPIRVMATDNADQATNFGLHQAILAAFAASHVDLPLRFGYAGRLFRMMGRPRMVEPDADLLKMGRLMVEAGFIATDPRIYADQTTSFTMSLPSDTGGITLPRTLPLSIPATLSTGRLTVVNEGTYETPWRGIISGPALNPRLVNFTTGQELRFGIDVPVGRYLDVDSYLRRVLLDGTASRRGKVSGQWWQLAPGSNDVGWFADVDNEQASFQIIFRSAWR